MDKTIEDLQDTFKIGYEQFEESRLEAEQVWNMYHNRQYTADQLEVLANRGQPAETFNVIKLFARMLLGYYSTVVNTITANPKDLNSLYSSAVLSDTIQHVLSENNFESEADRIKLAGLIAGLLIVYIEVVPTGEKDIFGRTIYTIRLSYVPDRQCILDPASTEDDYSDGKFFHRFKWLHMDTVNSTFGEGTTDKLDENASYDGFRDTELDRQFNGPFTGKYKVHDMYLIVHSIIETSDGKRWMIYWSGDEVLKEKEITHKEVKFPYRVQKIHPSDDPEYYGIFREVAESQKAINQALLKLQLMANTEKAFVEEGAVDDIDEFADAFNRVSGVIPVKSLSGIKLENTTREVLDQYTIIDKAFDRIQRILSINDSFLGMAFASDSGRKVKLQQNATIIALRYLTNRIEKFYRLLGWDIANLAKQYFTSYQVLRIADSTSGERWVEINRPIVIPTGRTLPNGEQDVEFAFEEVIDQDTGQPARDANGAFLLAPIPVPETELQFTKFDIKIESVAYNDEDERNQLMLETTLSGNIGNMLATVNPAGYFKAAALSVKTMKTKHSPDIAQILDETSQMLGGNQEAAGQASAAAEQLGGQNGGRPPSSQELKLPANTNESA